MRIMLVTEDEDFSRMLSAVLEPAGYTTGRVGDSVTVLNRLDAGGFAAMILDLDGPTLSAAEVLRRTKAGFPVPVIALTARNSADYRIQSLDLGADDCLNKPFKAAELLARLRAVVRRAQGHTRSVIVHGDIELDMGAKSVRQGGQWVRLTPREYAVLALLMTRIGQILTKAEIEAQVYALDDEAESNTVEAAIYAIRKKLGRELIGMVRGVGYVIPGK